jgi:DNA-binding XRE family transcriptional regulator
MNQIDFSSRVGISQATLSELEQDKYKPSVEIIISIISEFHSDLTWLLLGMTSSSDKVFDEKVVNEKEAELLVLFDKLNSVDQEEIIDIIKKSLRHY